MVGAHKLTELWQPRECQVYYLSSNLSLNRENEHKIESRLNLVELYKTFSLQINDYRPVGNLTLDTLHLRLL